MRMSFDLDPCYTLEITGDVARTLQRHTQVQAHRVLLRGSCNAALEQRCRAHRIALTQGGEGSGVQGFDMIGIESEDDWENVGRGAYPRTKAGKADPRAQPVIAQSARERELADKLAEVDAKLAKLDENLTARDRQAQTQQFVSNYLDSAVKAIPTTPTLIGKLHAKSPDKARQALLTQREREVLSLLLEGLPTKLIAHELRISSRTAEHHRAAVIQKMQARNISHLIRMAFVARNRSGGETAQ